jgi:hypothetical protein
VNVKLAEALVLRADAKKRLAALRDRLNASALVQEGEAPPEDPASLLAEVADLNARLERLVVLVNRTNLATTLPDGSSLTAALARRDALDLEHSVIAGVVQAASNRVARYSRTEIRLVATVDVAALRRRLDDLARARRELDTLVQATNWSTDLLD